MTGARRLTAGIAVGLAVLAGLAPVTLSAFLPGNPIDVPTFVTEIERVEAALSEATPASLDAVRASLPPKWVVRVGTQDLDVSSRWLASLIEEAERDRAGWPAARARLLSRVAAYRVEAQAAAAAPDPSPADRGRTALHDILARREFEAGRTEAWTGALRDKAGQWLLDLWRRLGGERLGQRGTAIALAWIAALAAIAVLVSWLVKGLVRASNESALRLTVPASRRRSARAWARDALAAVDPAEAARCAYHAVLRRLEEEGTWRMDETRTPREYLRLLPAAHDRRPILADITHRFEQIRYGAREATADDARSVVAHLKELGCLPAD